MVEINKTEIDYNGGHSVYRRDISHTYKSVAAIRLFISSHDEIEDFCSMDKKTGRRYGLRTCIYTVVYLRSHMGWLCFNP